MLERTPVGPVGEAISRGGPARGAAMKVAVRASGCPAAKTCCVGLWDKMLWENSGTAVKGVTRASYAGTNMGAH